ncbi:MAG: hypothetical protein JWO06_3423 [Bacteroidota bacterium]|nr:hypothetical protein [Bacteroidota bacterium]
MKKLLLQIVLFFSLPVLAGAQNVCSGLDGVDIYRNNKLAATWTPAEVPVLRSAYTKPDTLMFHAWTALESLKNATVDVKDNTGAIMGHIYGSNNTGYEANFTYILNGDVLDDPKVKSLDVFFNITCERDIQPVQIAIIILHVK